MSGDRNEGREGWHELTPAEAAVIEEGGTERAFTGKYWDHHADGTYVCKRCGAPLFASDTKFDSGTGWPSFDDALPGAVREVSDWGRTEIVCAKCGAHLGHVFRGERMTERNTRHCVNSASLDFQPTGAEAAPAKEARADAYFAGGCFWGVEHLLEGQPGVIDVVSGYMGGHLDQPGYKQVSSGTTGHAETVHVVYDPTKTTYEALAKRFFEIHDPTERGHQGPDYGPQYRSAIFVTDAEQRRVIEGLIAKLRARGYDVVTEVEPAGKFWPAEEYHQDYYERSGKEPYCHIYTPRFGD
ncbi:MAG: bifunctional methionine sulfoxide reductase B/A protein [Deltaproteobacteria bacterium]|nr:bifunctional methionine sulfoxide reductase B/A protein [Deltaproteobacteria bacterium]